MKNEWLDRLCDRLEELSAQHGGPPTVKLPDPQPEESLTEWIAKNTPMTYTINHMEMSKDAHRQGRKVYRRRQ